MARDLFRFRGRSKAGDQNPILTTRQQQLIEEEQALLARLVAILEPYPAEAADLAELRRAAEQLTSLFLLVVVGEFNSGKSAFINALIGENIMPEGVLPTTAVINLLRYADEPYETALPDGVIERGYPASFLRDIAIVDTPGTNAIIREHERLTQQFVPRADLVLFVTSADRPFSESEREFMSAIREWGKKIVIVINKIDLLPDDAARQQVEQFVRDNVTRLLGFVAEVFSVSSLLAQQAKELADRNPAEAERLWKASRFEAIQDYIINTLDEESRIRLKLLNPLGIAEHTAERYLADARQQLNVLKDDVQTIENIDRQLEIYQEDMRRQFAYHLNRIEAIIAKMINRGDAFFEETVRIGRIFDLFNSEKIRQEFERQVVHDTAQQIDAAIDELIDWMVEQDLRIWESVNDYVDRRRLAKYETEFIGEVSNRFRYDRRALLESVSRRAREEIERYDARAEAEDISQSLRNAVAMVAVTEAGAVGLGALIAAAASTLAVDVTGILAASLVAGVGLFVLPRRRRQAREEFRQRAEELERRLMEAMREQFEHELNRSVMRVTDAIAPYTRFVRSQQEKLTEVEAQLESVRNDLRAFRLRIGGQMDTIPLPESNTPARLTDGDGQQPEGGAPEVWVAPASDASPAPPKRSSTD